MKAFDKMDRAIDLLTTGSAEEAEALFNEAFAELDAEQAAREEERARLQRQHVANLKAIDDWKQSEMAKIRRDENRLKKKYGRLWPNL